jgi:hypothetical protein
MSLGVHLELLQVGVDDLLAAVDALTFVSEESGSEGWEHIRWRLALGV